MNNVTIWDALDMSDTMTLQALIDADQTVVHFHADNGMTPLVLAVKMDRVDMVACLLRNHADPNRTTNLHSRTANRVDAKATPVMFAKSVAMLAQLLSGGADLGTRDGDGNSAMFRVALAYDTEMLDLAVSRGAKLDDDETDRLAELASDELRYRTASGGADPHRLTQLRGTMDWCERHRAKS